MSLTDDQLAKLMAIHDLVGKDRAEAFMEVMKNSSRGDRLGSILQFIIDASLSSEVVTVLVTDLIDDPAFDLRNASDSETKGLAHMIQGMLDSELAMQNLPRAKAMGSRPELPDPNLAGPMMEKTELLTHLADKCGISQDAVNSVLTELADLAVSETNAHNVFEIPGIGRMVKAFRNERIGRNPQTGEEIVIPAKTSVRFRVDSDVRARCGESPEEPIKPI